METPPAGKISLCAASERKCPSSARKLPPPSEPLRKRVICACCKPGQICEEKSCAWDLLRHITPTPPPSGTNPYETRLKPTESLLRTTQPNADYWTGSTADRSPAPASKLPPSAGSRPWLPPARNSAG